MTDVAKRIRLLKENGDCEHCCGDHKPDLCTRKQRVCGGGKDDRGCNRTHNIHELFCSAAKVCFSVQVVHTANSNNNAESISNTWRVFGKLTQKFGDQESDNEESASTIKNAFCF